MISSGDSCFTFSGRNARITFAIKGNTQPTANHFQNDLPCDLAIKPLMRGGASIAAPAIGITMISILQRKVIFTSVNERFPAMTAELIRQYYFLLSISVLLFKHPPVACIYRRDPQQYKNNECRAKHPVQLICTLNIPKKKSNPFVHCHFINTSMHFLCSC